MFANAGATVPVLILLYSVTQQEHSYPADFLYMSLHCEMEEVV